MLEFAEIKSLYPNEWVLLGNPLLKGAHVLNGLVIYAHKDKRNVCEFAQTVIHNFEMVKIIFTGKMPKIVRLDFSK